MRLAVLLMAAVWGVDDSTMSLIANVDPIPARVPEGLIELTASQPSLPNESFVPFAGIQVGNILHQPVTQLRSHSSKIRVQTVHLHDAPKLADPSLGTVTPDVLICYLPKGQNGLSVRACDVNAVGGAVPSQLLRCTSRIHPNSVADLLVGSQTVPVDFTQGPELARRDLRNMDTPVTAKVTLDSCTSPRSSLPDTALDTDHLVFVLLNPVVESAAENYLHRNAQHGSVSVRAGLVFVAIDQLFGTPATRNRIATNFLQDVAKCNEDGFCSAKELVQWTPSGDQTVDWFVGTSRAYVRLS